MHIQGNATVEHVVDLHDIAYSMGALNEYSVRVVQHGCFEHRTETNVISTDSPCLCYSVSW